MAKFFTAVSYLTFAVGRTHGTLELVRRCVQLGVWPPFSLNSLSPIIYGRSRYCVDKVRYAFGERVCACQEEIRASPRLERKPHNSEENQRETSHACR